MVAEEKMKTWLWLEVFFEKCCSRRGNGGVDLFFLRWSNGKVRYFYQRRGHRSRSRGPGEGKGRGLVSLGTCLLWTRIYTPRGPEASADMGYSTSLMTKRLLLRLGALLVQILEDTLIVIWQQDVVNADSRQGLSVMNACLTHRF